MTAKDRKPASISKPTLVMANEALSFASGASTGTRQGVGKDKGDKTAQTPSKASQEGLRIFFAPEGDKRLTINIREDLHKKLKIAAIEQGITAGEILESLIEKHL
jgi:hypothetical protein